MFNLKYWQDEFLQWEPDTYEGATEIFLGKFFGLNLLKPISFLSLHRHLDSGVFTLLFSQLQ